MYLAHLSGVLFFPYAMLFCCGVLSSCGTSESVSFSKFGKLLPHNSIPLSILKHLICLLDHLLINALNFLNRSNTLDLCFRKYTHTFLE